MDEMKVVEKKHEQGASLKLIFSVTSRRDAETCRTSEMNIRNLAGVCFEFKATGGYGYNNQKLACSVSAWKHELAKNDTVKLFITCKPLNFSAGLICADKADIWSLMGEKFYDLALSDQSYFLFVLEICIIVSKTDSIMTKVYNDKNFAEIQLSTADGSVLVHKSFLAAHSDMFKTMFDGEWKETSERRIELEGATMQTLQQLKDYMYLGTLPDDADGLRPLLLLAMRYLITDLKAECILRLGQTVTPENLFDLLEFARGNNVPELTLAIIQLTPDKVVEDVHEMLKNPAEAVNAE